MQITDNTALGANMKVAGYTAFGANMQITDNTALGANMKVAGSLTNLADV